MTPRKPQNTWSAVEIEAMVVPITGLALQAGYAAVHEGGIPLLSLLFHSVTLPVILLAVITVAFLSYLLLRPFSRDRKARTVVLVSCMAASAVVACFATPVLVK